MLLTAQTVLIFFLVALATITIGHYLKRVELYALGVLFLFLFSGFYWYNGLSEKTGETTSTSPLNVTTTTYTYEQNRTLWVDFTSVAGMLVAVILALTTYREWTEYKQEARETRI